MYNFFYLSDSNALSFFYLVICSEIIRITWLSLQVLVIYVIFCTNGTNSYTSSYTTMHMQTWQMVFVLISITIHRNINMGNKLPVSICMCLVSNVTRVYLSVSCVQCYPCLSFCVLCPMVHVSIFLCLVSNVTRVYLYKSCVHCYPCLDTRHIQIDTCNIGNKTQKDRHVYHWAQYTER
jgi:hypothetical protein